MASLVTGMNGLALASGSRSSAFMTGGDAIRGQSSRRSCSSASVHTLTIEAAHKKGAGSTKNGRDSKPKMLGVKIYGDQPAQPGAIIVRQRGTTFHPGNNVGLGRDYTIFSKIDGLVKFEKFGPDRKKISVYPNLVEKVENPNSRRVKRREEFRMKREKRKAFQLSKVLGAAGIQFAEADLRLASVPESDEEAEVAVC